MLAAVREGPGEPQILVSLQSAQTWFVQIFEPFDSSLWGMLLVSVLFVTYMFWFIEQLEPSQRWVDKKVCFHVLTAS